MVQELPWDVLVARMRNFFAYGDGNREGNSYGNSGQWQRQHNNSGNDGGDSGRELWLQQGAGADMAAFKYQWGGVSKSLS